MIELYDFSIGYGSCMLLDKVDTSFGKGQLTALMDGMVPVNPRFCVPSPD